ERLTQSRKEALADDQSRAGRRKPVLDEIVGNDHAPGREWATGSIRPLDAADRAVDQCPLNAGFLEDPGHLERADPGGYRLTRLVAVPAMHRDAQNSLPADLEQLERT